MSGLVKAVAVMLVAGILCSGAVAAAEQTEGEEAGETPGEVPLYYTRLSEYSTSVRECEASGKPVLLQYCIQPGDNLTDIAQRWGTDVESLVTLNNIFNPHYIIAGDVIEVITVVGSVHDVSEGDTITTIAELYGVDEEVILSANDIDRSAVLDRGERVIVPGGRHPQAAIQASQASQASFCWPMQGILTSGYGWRGDGFHYGIDIAAPIGTPFYASAAGTVTYSGYRGAYGIMVEVDHGGGYITRYAHGSGTAVDVGQYVSQGQVLGYVGLTGNTTGPHLHFELLCGADRLDPLPFLY